MSIDTFSIELNKLSQSDGSAVVNLGLTCVLAAVYGPADCRGKKENAEKAVVEVTFKPKVGQSVCEDKAIENVIQKTFETAIVTLLHPRTSINIIVQEVQNDGCLLSSSVNAACLALLDAAVSMQFMVAAVDCAIDDDGNVIINPNKKAENSPAHVTVIFENTQLNIVACISKGQVNDNLLDKCIMLCKDEVQKLFHMYRKTMESKIRKFIH